MQIDKKHRELLEFGICKREEYMKIEASIRNFAINRDTNEALSLVE